MKTLVMVFVVLLMLPALPAAAQERCVNNPVGVSQQVRNEIQDLRNRFADLNAEERAQLRRLEARANWDAQVGAGNGWVSAGPNSCVLHYDSSNRPVLGTKLYFLGSAAEGTQSLQAGAQSAIVTNGPARIRSGPGLEHARVRWCSTGWPLTIWGPAQGGWLRASCFGANGWIHESLVSTGAAPPAASDEGRAVVSAPAGVGNAQQAVVSNGPARIRKGPGLEHGHLRWCGINWPLTVWSPAVNGWLRASCFGANGWIHHSLVSIGGGAAAAPATEATGATAAATAVAAAAVSAPVSGSGQAAVVISGPARIRSGPGTQHSHVRWCGINWPLTVWTPAQDGWLQASCYGANGWIHESLVSISG